MSRGKNDIHKNGAELLREILVKGKKLKYWLLTLDSRIC